MKVLHNLKDPVFEDQYAESYVQILAYFFDQAFILEYYPDFTRFIGLIHLESENSSPISVKELKEGDFLKNFNYKKKILVHPANKFTLIPNEFYEDSEKEKIFNLNFKSTKGISIKNHQLEQLNSQIIFAQTSELNKICDQYQCTNIIGSSVSFINGLLGLEEIEKAKYIHIDIEPEYIKIIFFKYGKLVFFNAFNYHQKEDILFHIMNVSKQLGINPNEDEYSFSGNILEDSQTYGLLLKYIRHAHLITKPTSLSFSSIFDEINIHQYYTSLFSVLCV